MSKNLLTAQGLAEYLDVKTEWVYDNKHRLPTLRVGRELRFRLSEVDAWLESCRERPTIFS